MNNEVWNISEQELRRAIKMMNENQATDECGLIAEYLKSLVERDVHNLRMLLNEVLSEDAYQMSGRRVGLFWYTSEAQERVKELQTFGNYKCSVKVVHDGGKRENKWMGRREWDAG